MDFSHYAHSILYTVMLYNLANSYHGAARFDQNAILVNSFHGAAAAFEKKIMRQQMPMTKQETLQKGTGRVHNLTSTKHLVINFVHV